MLKKKLRICGEEENLVFWFGAQFNSTNQDDLSYSARTFISG